MPKDPLEPSDDTPEIPNQHETPAQEPLRTDAAATLAQAEVSKGAIANNQRRRKAGSTDSPPNTLRTASTESLTPPDSPLFSRIPSSSTRSDVSVDDAGYSSSDEHFAEGFGTHRMHDVDPNKQPDIELMQISSSPSNDSPTPRRRSTDKPGAPQVPPMPHHSLAEQMNGIGQDLEGLRQQPEEPKGLLGGMFSRFRKKDRTTVGEAMDSEADFSDDEEKADNLFIAQSNTPPNTPTANLKDSSEEWKAILKAITAVAPSLGLTTETSPDRQSIKLMKDGKEKIHIARQKNNSVKIKSRKPSDISHLIQIIQSANLKYILVTEAESTQFAFDFYQAATSKAIKADLSPEILARLAADTSDPKYKALAEQLQNKAPTRQPGPNRP